MTHASLFSGIGGPEVAAAMLGWENVFHCEINPFGRAVLDYWFPDSVSYEDITKTDFTRWRGHIDVLTGGFPCQPFSYAGKRGGREDERYLWPQMLRAIDEIRPAWVVGENVTGITTMVEGGVLSDLGGEATLFEESDGVHRYSLEQSFTIERICRDLERAGYSVQPMLIPAAAVGAPHRRDRIFIIAQDADNNGRRKREHEVQGNQRNLRDPGAGNPERICREKGIDSSYADGRRSRQVPAPVHARQSDGNEHIGDGCERNAPNSHGSGLQESQFAGRGEDSAEERAGMDDRTERPRCDADTADTDTKRLSAAVQSGLHGEEKRDGQKRPTFYTSDDAWIEGSWWNNFPTVSPVHRGNDGIPIRLDDLSISFNRWRTESLKAFGNAIVPQVMYRIFQAIEQAAGM